MSQSLDKISGISTDTSTGGTQLAESSRSLLTKIQEFNTLAGTLGDLSANLQQTVGRFELGEISHNGSESSAPEHIVAVKKSKTAKTPASAKTTKEKAREKAS